MSIKEQWKPVRGFEGRYSISNKGRVWSDVKNEIMRPCVGIQSTQFIFCVGGKRSRITLTGLMREHWKFEFLNELDADEEVKQFENYFVTNKGRVWSNHFYRWISPVFEYPYYWRVRLNGRSYKVHRLVGRLFLEDFDETLCVLHRNENLPFPEINHSSNLFVGSGSDNRQDCVNKGRNKGRLSARKVAEIREDLAKGISIEKIGEKFSLHPGAIGNIARGKTHAQVR